MSAYRMISVPSHPRAHKHNRTLAEHIVIAEQALGRYLPIGVHVHHVDGDRANNANRNLVICQDAGYHRLLHFRARILKAGGDPNTQFLCHRCKRLLPQTEFNLRIPNDRNTPKTRCRECDREKVRLYNERRIAEGRPRRHVASPRISEAA